MSTFLRLLVVAVLSLSGVVACSSPSLGDLCDGGSCTVNVNVNFDLPDGSGGSAFDPSSLAGLRLWLRENRDVIAGSGSAVSEWDDLSSGGHNYVAGTSSLVTLTPSALDFDGGTGLQNGEAGTNATSFTVFAVVQPSAVGPATLFATGTGGGAEPLSIGIGSAGQLAIFGGGGGGFITSAVPSSSAPSVIAAVGNSGIYENLYVNGVGVGSATVGTMLVDLGGGSIGDFSSGSYTGYQGPFVGKVFELLQWSRVLDPTEFALVEGALETRYPH